MYKVHESFGPEEGSIMEDAVQERIGNVIMNAEVYYYYWVSSSCLTYSPILPPPLPTGPQFVSPRAHVTNLFTCHTVISYSTKEAGKARLSTTLSAGVGKTTSTPPPPLPRPVTS